MTTLTPESMPVSYDLHFGTVFCAHCATSSFSSAFYAVYNLRSRSGAGIVRQKLPCAKPTYNLPVTRTNTGHTVLPYCANCTHIDLSHLPRPATRAHLYDVPGPPMREPTPAQRAATATRKPTLEDLA
jgi:hypothetical protein